MKTERRHELQTNVLADHLGKWIVAVKPFANMIIIGVVAVAVVLAAWSVFSSNSATKRGKAWDDFEAARQQYVTAIQSDRASENSSSKGDDVATNAAVTELEEVIRRYEGQPVAHWARLLLGNHFQTVGTRQLFHDRELARDELKKAADHFRNATDSKQEDVQQQAYFGLGQANECQGELDRAIEAYQKLVDTWPNGPYAATAKAYIENLEKPETREFYVNYQKQDPDAARRRENDPIGGVLNPDSFKIPGVDEGPKQPLDTGPFIPKVTVPGGDVPDPSLPDDGSGLPLPDEPDLPKLPVDDPAETPGE